MRPTTELIRIWTEALVPVCNHSKSHASQELKWLLQHAKEQAFKADRYASSHSGDIIRQVPRAGGLSDKEISLMQDYVSQRVKTRKPLQYIIGTQPFMDLEILTRPPTLIPRWETDEWTARLASVLKSEPGLFTQQKQEQQQQRVDPASAIATSSTASSSSSSLFNILDICTGSGCIPLGLASALPFNSCNIFGVDIHPKAVQLARDNEISNRTLLNGNTVQFRQADLLESNAVNTFLSWLQTTTSRQHLLDKISGSSICQGESTSESSTGFHVTKTEPQLQGHATPGYNLIISNPPYIAHSEYETLEPEVAQWEDPKALLADHEGLMFYPRIANMAMALLHHDQLNHHISFTSSNSGSNPIMSRQWRNGPDLDKVKVPELVFEVGGDHQVDSVTAAVREAGFSRVEVWKDLADRARCVIGAR